MVYVNNRNSISSSIIKMVNRYQHGRDQVAESRNQYNVCRQQKYYVIMPFRQAPIGNYFRLCKMWGQKTSIRTYKVQDATYNVSNINVLVAVIYD